jgi:hypothetical protein
MARRHGIRISPLAITALNANFAAAKVTDCRFSLLLGAALFAMNALRCCGPRPFHRPVITVPNHKTIVLCHVISFFNGVGPINWKGQSRIDISNG